MRQTIQNRRSQLFTAATSLLCQKDFMYEGNDLIGLQWTDFDDFARKYDSGVNRENYAGRALHWNFYEVLGYYLRTGQLDMGQLNTMNGGGLYVMYMWAKFGDVIKRYREIMKWPDYFMNFEYLADEMAKYRKGKGYEVILDGSGGNYFPDAKH
jgi:hypothetical protein